MNIAPEETYRRPWRTRSRSSCDPQGCIKTQGQVRRATNNKADEQPAHQSTNGNHVPSSKLPEVRERLGTIRPVRNVHGKMGMGRWRMEIGWFFLDIAATAAIALDANSWGTPDQSATMAMGSTASLVPPPPVTTGLSHHFLHQQGSDPGHHR